MGRISDYDRFFFPSKKEKTTAISKSPIER
jgi:hypothetical protein